MPKSQYIYSDPTISTSANGDTPYGIYDNDISFKAYSFHSIIEPLNGLLDGKGQTTNIGIISEFLEHNKNK